MTKQLTIEEAARLFGDAGDKLSGALLRAMSDNLGDALDTARKYSSGGLSLVTLAQMGHPYRIGGSPPTDPAIINRQSGEFYRNWRIVDFVDAKDRVSGTVLNDDPAVRFLKGTRKMIPRPITQAVAAEIAPRVRERFAKALSEVLR